MANVTPRGVDRSGSDDGYSAYTADVLAANTQGAHL